jgi:hypothetical protein
VGEATRTDDEAGTSLVIIMIAASGLPQCGVPVKKTRTARDGQPRASATQPKVKMILCRI